MTNPPTDTSASLPEDSATPEPTHVVTGPLAIVSTSNDQRVYVYEGGVIPPDTPDDEVDRLVDSGLVTAIADLPERPEPPREGQELIKSIIERQPDRAGGLVNERSGGDVERAALPSRSASKGAWIDYATSRGMDRETAESMTRDELADYYATAR